MVFNTTDPAVHADPAPQELVAHPDQEFLRPFTCAMGSNPGRVVNRGVNVVGAFVIDRLLLLQFCSQICFVFVCVPQIAGKPPTPSYPTSATSGLLEYFPDEFIELNSDVLTKRHASNVFRTKGRYKSGREIETVEVVQARLGRV